MNIQDAILQAGEGGVVRREGKNIGAKINVGAFETFPLGIDNLCATDWEVVAPDIEVGDVVSLCDRTGEWIITGLSSGSSQAQGKATLKSLFDSSVVITAKHAAKLIRKGAENDKKRSWSGVEMVTREGCSCIIFQRTGSDPMYPWASRYNQSKTYTMTLTEEAE